MHGHLITAFPPLPPGVWLRRPVAHPPFPLGEPGCLLFARGRHAIWQGVQALGLRPGDEVLAPAYHHGSEIEALARAGLVCRFYGACETLAIDEAELDSLVGPRTRALHLIHYLGFPQDAPRWRRWCDVRGLVMIEDAAQAWLASLDGRPVGSFGDLSIACIYKTLGLSDGVAVVCRAVLPGVTGRRRLGLDTVAVEHALWMATRSGALSAVARKVEGRFRRDGPDDFDLGDPTTPPRAVASWVALRLDDLTIAAIRRRNYARLAAELGRRVPGEFLPLPPGASPLAFPLFSADKGRLRKRLAVANDIRALDLWSTPHPALPVARFPYAARLRASLLGLPVHQELRPRDVERMLDAVAGAEP